MSLQKFYFTAKSAEINEAENKYDVFPPDMDTGETQECSSRNQAKRKNFDFFFLKKVREIVHRREENLSTSHMEKNLNAYRDCEVKNYYRETSSKK